MPAMRNTQEKGAFGFMLLGQKGTAAALGSRSNGSSVAIPSLLPALVSAT